MGVIVWLGGASDKNGGAYAFFRFFLNVFILLVGAQLRVRCEIVAWILAFGFGRFGGMFFFNCNIFLLWCSIPIIYWFLPSLWGFRFRLFLLSLSLLWTDGRDGPGAGKGREGGGG